MKMVKVVGDSRLYKYLGYADSRLYSKVKDSKNKKDKIIARLLRAKARSCYYGFLTSGR
jgi:hypothetical protein